MYIYSKTIYAKTKKEYDKQKKEIIKELKKYGIEYGIIEGERGYYATVTYTIY